MSPDEMDDVESPALHVQPPGRRRGAISAEPIREEDIESYVKKVHFMKTKIRVKCNCIILCEKRRR